MEDKKNSMEDKIEEGVDQDSSENEENVNIVKTEDYLKEDSEGDTDNDGDDNPECDADSDADGMKGEREEGNEEVKAGKSFFKKKEKKDKKDIIIEELNDKLMRTMACQRSIFFCSLFLSSNLTTVLFVMTGIIW